MGEKKKPIRRKKLPFGIPTYKIIEGKRFESVDEENYSTMKKAKENALRFRRTGYQTRIKEVKVSEGRINYQIYIRSWYDDM